MDSTRSHGSLLTELSYLAREGQDGGSDRENGVRVEGRTGRMETPLWSVGGTGREGVRGRGRRCNNLESNEKTNDV